MTLPPPGESLRCTETDRFRLRPLTSADEGLYRDIYCNADTMRYVGKPLSHDDAGRSFRAAVKQTADASSPIHFLAIEERSRGNEIGICGVHHGVPALGEAEIGIMLKSDARRERFSHEAFGAFISHLFASSSVERLWVRYAIGHVAVDRMVSRLGFAMASDQRRNEVDLPWRRAWVRREGLQWQFQSTNRD
jgi:[ribosomal protein S5]-alanine N-acetyltransferase